MGLRRPTETFEEVRKEGKQAANVNEMNASYYMFDTDTGLYSNFGDTCYSSLRYRGSVNRIVVFHKHLPEYYPYVNYVLNSPLFGDCFVTKDAKEGFENGFELNVNQPRNIVYVAAIALRSPFENLVVNEMFTKFKELDMSDDEAFYLGLIGREITNHIEISGVAHGIPISGAVRLKDVVKGTTYLKRSPFIEAGDAVAFGDVDKTMGNYRENSPYYLERKVAELADDYGFGAFNSKTKVTKATDENWLKLVESLRKDMNSE